MQSTSPSFDPAASSMQTGSQAVSSPMTSPSIQAPPSPPRRQTVSSASEMPQKDLKAAVFSQHVASHHYVDHYRKSMESLRQQHREERAMWDIERQELLFKVAELEAKITRISHLHGGDVPSIADALSKFSLGSSSSSRSASAPGLAPVSAMKEQSLSPGTGGPPGSISLEKTASHGHMESIPEGNEAAKTVTFATDEDMTNEQLNRELAGQAVPGELVDKDLDGVIIKATSLPVSIKKAILEDSQSPSPLRSPSPLKSPETNPTTPQRPVTIEIPSTQKVLQLPSKELYTLAAGHTPLARVADLSEESTGVSTPIALQPTVHTAEVEKPPLEPHPSTQDVKPLRPPHERGDSYFNVPVPHANDTGAAPEQEPLPPTTAWKDPQLESNTVETQAIKSFDDDPALKGPLNMPHRPSQDKNQQGGDFLTKLDERLVNLSKEQDVSKRSILSEIDNGNREGVDPPLRIKRSLNFGSQWGLGNAGRDA